MPAEKSIHASIIWCSFRAQPKKRRRSCDVRALRRHHPGGGHNGLTCGAYLARAGLSTVVLERRPVIGGAAVTEEIIPGFRFSVFSYLMSLLHPKVIADSRPRSNHGFEVLPATRHVRPDSRGQPHRLQRFGQEDASELRPLFAEGRRRLSRVRSLSDGIGGDPAQGAARDAARSRRAGTGSRSSRRCRFFGSTAGSAASCSVSSTSSR